MNVACTIVARNYLAFARVLAKSYSKHNKGEFVVLVLDGLDEIPDDDRNLFTVITPNEIGIDLDELLKMRLIYSVMEFATAVKPWLINTLLKRGAANVMYLDPDIMVFEPLDEIYKYSSESGIVLTPHVTKPMSRDNKLPGEMDIQISGIYNLGFIAVSSGSDEFLTFWMDRLKRDCVVDIPKSLFVDQRWIDFVPGIFACKILTDTSYNVAYWNIDQRELTDKNDKFFIDGEPLHFFHFSGYNPNNSYVLSKYQGAKPRIRPGSHDSLQKICDLYKENLLENDYLEVSKFKYQYDTTPSGITITPPLRKLYRNALLKYERDDFATKEPPNPFVEGQEHQFIDWLNEPADPIAIPVDPRIITNRIGVLNLLLGENLAARAIIHFAKRVKTQRDKIRRVKIKQGKTPEVFRTSIDSQNDLSKLTITRYLESVWRQRPDLMNAFPDPFNRDKEEFLNWVSVSGVKECVPEVLSHGAPRKAVITRPDSSNKITPINPVQFESEKNRRHGVNVVGYLTTESGKGEEARNLISSIQAAGITYAAFDLSGTVSRRGHRFTDWGENRYDLDINILSVNADRLSPTAIELGGGFFSERHTIALFAWETEDFPPSMVHAFDHIDEIWANSSFAQKAIAANTKLPVYAFPLPVQVPMQVDEFDFNKFDIPQNRFKFLFCFDFLSLVERKNPLGLLKAFDEAFKPNEGPILILKTLNDKFYPKAQSVYEEALKRPDVFILDQYLSDKDRFSLMASVDCYVSLHRAEGFGLTLAESMALGKPVIGTGYSGNMEFMTEENSFIVPYDKCRIPPHTPPYVENGLWANPDLKLAAQYMRQVVEDPKLALTKAQLGKETIQASHGPESRKDFIIRRLSLG